MDRKLVNIGAFLIAGSIVFFMGRAMMADVKTPCAVSLKKAFTALQMYAVENDERFPEAARWMDRLQQQGDLVTGCDSVQDGYGLAFNDRYSTAILPNASDADGLLLFDSTKLGRNEHDKGESLPNPGRHRGKNHAILATGTLVLDYR